MEFFKFIFSSWWTNLVFLFILVYLMEWFKRVIEMFLVHRNIRKHGYRSTFLEDLEKQNKEKNYGESKD